MASLINPATKMEVFIRFAKIEKQVFITAVYTNQPEDYNDYNYSRRVLKTEDIPFLRITRKATYNEDEMYGGLILHIQYLHYKGLALDVHPEVGTLPYKWIHNKSIENGYLVQTPTGEVMGSIEEPIK